MVISVFHHSEIQAVLKSIAEKTCLLTTPSFLSTATRDLRRCHPPGIWWGLIVVQRHPPLGKDFLDAQLSRNGSPLWLKFGGYILNRNARELDCHSLLRVC